MRRDFLYCMVFAYGSWRAFIPTYLCSGARHDLWHSHAVRLELLVLIALLTVALACGGGWLLFYRPWAGPRTRYPIVLAHGFLGFEQLQVGSVTHDYFRGIAQHLRTQDITVHCPAVPPVASIATRAANLAEYVRALPARRVNIVAHSMGGLDARYAISKLGLGRRVASLTTLGTPHHGTPAADVGASMLGAKFGLKKLFGNIGLVAFYDLTTTHMESFNLNVPNIRGVYYASAVATVAERRAVHPLLQPTYLFLKRAAGPNDGIVPGESQAWGEVLYRLEADHWAQIGWSANFDASALYLEIAHRLRRRGF